MVIRIEKSEGLVAGPTRSSTSLWYANIIQASCDGIQYLSLFPVCSLGHSLYSTISSSNLLGRVVLKADRPWAILPWLVV